VARRALAKLDEGDIKGAVRTLCSSEQLVEPSPETLRLLQAKHPPRPLDYDLHLPSVLPPPLIASQQDVEMAIRSFPAGSAGGFDGLRPQHLKDLTSRQVGGSLLQALTAFVNLVLAGETPERICPVFFGASLLPFKKADGGVRPIAVGLTLRRLIAKAACHHGTVVAVETLKPRQLGVGVKGGAEALAHGARLFLASLPSDSILVKLDFSNAFNSIRRDKVLETVASSLPGLLRFAASAYSSPSKLFLGSETLDSAEGVQQGDPLEPLLFSLTIHPLLQATESDFVSGYLDDVSIGGEASMVGADVRRL